jgi:hypothetical protein
MNELGRLAAALLAASALGGLAYGLIGDPRSPGPLSAGPLSAGPLSAAARGRPPFEARVIERLPAGSYTYFHVERGDRTHEWVVTLASSSGGRAVRTGARLRVTPIAYSERFQSKRLDRVFDRLHFAVIRPL